MVPSRAYGPYRERGIALSLHPAYSAFSLQRGKAPRSRVLFILAASHDESEGRMCVGRSGSADCYFFIVS